MTYSENSQQELINLANELQSKRSQQLDLVVSSEEMYFFEKQLTVEQAAEEVLPGITTTATKLKLIPSNICHGNLSNILEIPKKYYDKMLADKDHEIFDLTLNHWLDRQEKKQQLIRCYVKGEEGIARAVLSDRYGIIDNYDLLATCLNTFEDIGLSEDIQLIKADLTEGNMYLCFTCPKIDIDAGDILKDYRARKGNDNDNGIISGFIIKNSEVGKGMFQVAARAVVGKCNNGVTFKDDAFAKRHLGAELSSGIINWSEETMNKNMLLIQSQLRDAIRSFLSIEYLGSVVDRFKVAAGYEVKSLSNTIKNISQDVFRISEKKFDEIIERALGNDKNRLTVCNAFTDYAQNEDPDLKYQIEEQIYELVPVMNKYDKEFKLKRLEQ